MDGTSSFGYWLRRRRKALDLTQYELAHQAGCALDTIKKIETDARRPSRQLAERLAICLQLPAEQHAALMQLQIHRVPSPRGCPVWVPHL